MNNVLTIKEVMGILKVSHATVHNWMKSGKLKYTKTGRLTRIKSEDLDDFIGRKKVARLDMKAFLKMEVSEFARLRDSGTESEKRTLDYFLRRAEIEGFARGVVHEELERYGLIPKTRGEK
jgi:excisionase family DNA binding protein